MAQARRKHESSPLVRKVRPKAHREPADVLRLVVDTGPTLISFIGADCRYRWVNRAYEGWFGRPAASLLGLHLREVMGEGAWEVVRPYVERALAGETVSYEHELTLGNRRRWIHATYTPNRDEASTIRGFIVHAIDISERKRVEAELMMEKTFSEAAINGIPGVFYLFDASGRFLRWNQNFEAVSGYSAREIASMSPLDFFRGPDKRTIAEAINQAFRDGHVAVEASFVSKDGRSIPHYFVARRMYVGGVAYLVGEGMDLTSRRVAEETQRATLNILEDFDEERHNLQQVQKATLNLLEDVQEERHKQVDTQRALMNMLEDIEVERLTAEQAKSLLEAANKELEAFSYSVSHDLRAPLRAISGFAEAIMEDCAPRLDAEGKRYLGLIQENAHKMGQLIDDLLAFSRLGRQQMTETRIDMAALAKTVFDKLAAFAPPRDIRLTIGAVPPAQGDGTLVRQVLVNLLSNAIKFTKNKPQALIEFGYRSDGEVGAYYIKDNGVGFDTTRASSIPARASD